MRWHSVRPSYCPSIEAVLQTIRTEPCRELAQGYGQLLRDCGGRVPGKNGLDIGRFPVAVPHLLLSAVTKPDRCVYRLVGEAIRNRMGLKEIVGMNYYDLVARKRLASARAAMNMVVTVPCGFRSEVLEVNSSGQRNMVEVLGLPLASEEPGIDGFVLCAVGPLDPSERPRERGVWVAGTNVVSRELIDLGAGVDVDFVDTVPVCETLVA